MYTILGEFYCTPIKVTLFITLIELFIYGQLLCMYTNIKRSELLYYYYISK